MSKPGLYHENDVLWVFDKIGRGKSNYAGFIKKYLSEYDNINRSFIKMNPHNNYNPGRYFNNLIETCKKCLLSNLNYYHYNRLSRACVKMPDNGPTIQYSELLKHIVNNAKKYNKNDAGRIHTLLFWFEQEGLTALMIVPVNKTTKQVFETHQIYPGYFGEEDGTMQYCSITGKQLDNGMELSNTRVNALLSKMHNLGDDDDNDNDNDDDDDDDDMPSYARAGGPAPAHVPAAAAAPHYSPRVGCISARFSAPALALALAPAPAHAPAPAPAPAPSLHYYPSVGCMSGLFSRPRTEVRYPEPTRASHIEENDNGGGGGGCSGGGSKRHTTKNKYRRTHTRRPSTKRPHRHTTRRRTKHRRRH
jgi:hypothetical protein